MQTITLEIKTPQDAEVILLLARRLDCNIILPKKETSGRINKIKNNTKEILDIFKEISAKGNIKKVIPNPVKWQREIRKDRKILGR